MTRAILKTGSPVFINGIPVFHSNSTSGTVLGINRTNDYVVSNVIAAGSAQITQPLLRLAFNQVRQALGDDAVNGLLVHWHPSQGQAYEELGFNMSTYNLADQGGKGGAFDALFSGKKTVDGHVVIENIHADQTRADFIQPKVWDPPYAAETRDPGADYRYEMTEEQHRQLAECLRNLRGAVILSGYACELYDGELYPDWYRVERNALGDGAVARVEVLWMNRKLARQEHLFQNGRTETVD